MLHLGTLNVRPHATKAKQSILVLDITFICLISGSSRITSNPDIMKSPTVRLVVSLDERT